MRALGTLVMSWAEDMQRIQKQSIDVYGDIRDVVEKSEDATPLLVNAAAYFCAVADLSGNVQKLAAHLSRECNRFGGYQLDLGELSDVFEQQNEWNIKHCDGFRSVRVGKSDQERK